MIAPRWWPGGGSGEGGFYLLSRLIVPLSAPPRLAVKCNNHPIKHLILFFISTSWRTTALYVHKAWKTKSVLPLKKATPFSVHLGGFFTSLLPVPQMGSLWAGSRNSTEWKWNIIIFFSAGISSRSSSALLLDGCTNISDRTMEWEMLGWDQVAKVGMEVDNTSLNFLGNHRARIWEYFMDHLMTAAYYCCTPE